MIPRFFPSILRSKRTLSSIGEIPSLVVSLGHFPIFRNASLPSCQLILGWWLYGEVDPERSAEDVRKIAGYYERNISIHLW